MSKVVLGVVGVGVVVVGSWYVTAMGSQKEAKMVAEKAAMEQAAMEEKAMMETDAMGEMEKMSEGAMVKDEGAMTDEAMGEAGDTMMKDEMAKGMYAPYDTSKLAMAREGDVVLFFKANWCPSCRALDADIKASLGDIPGGLTILEVDYDTATALKQQYGVTTQHTLVQVAADGSLIAKWSGGSTLESVVAKVQ